MPPRSFVAMAMPRAIAVLLGSALSAALAQTAPDAGSLQQQLDRERGQSLPRRAAPLRPAEPAALTPLEGVIVTVREFRFAGNTLIDSGKLADVVAPFLNRPLDFAQLQAAAMAVARAYREAGWVVRAYLPAQEIRDGVVTIQVVEAVFGRVRLEGEPPARVEANRILRIFEAQQASGVPLRAEALDRALLLVDDLPGVIASGALRPGAQPGETDLALNLVNQPFWASEVSLDNNGARSTGANRINLNIAAASPLGLGDQFVTGVVHTEGSDYVRAGYTLPVGNDGWRVGANASHLNYRLVAPEFEALRARGNSSVAGLDASYPLVRSRLRNLYFNASFDRKSLTNESGGTQVSDYRVDALSLALNGNLFDDLGGGGANLLQVTYVGGRVNLDGSPNQASVASTTRADGRFGKLRWNLSRQQVITQDIALYGQFSGQIADRNLDSSERFYLGGPGGVRAYPTNEGGGSEGRLAVAELRWRLPEGFSAAAFYDWGRVKVNRNNDFAGGAALNSYVLKGHGVRFGWASPAGLDLKVIWARRDGNNPNPTSSGNDQDGSLVRDRVWLTATLPF